MIFRLSARSRGRLQGVHRDLVGVVERAIETSLVDFSVVEGVRSLATQRRYFELGKSKTMNSRHLTGHAVDLAPWIGDTISWEPRDFAPVARAMKEAARASGIPLEWGGDWTTFVDMPHFQLPRAQYP